MPKFRLILLSLLALCLPIIISAQTPIFSAENPIITPENANQVTQLAMIGHGIPERTAYSPDGTMIAVSSSVGIWLYDTNDLSAEPRLLSDKAQYGHIIPITFSPNSQFIAGGTGGELFSNQDSSIYIWDVQTSEMIHTLSGHTNGIMTLAYSPDGQTIASASARETYIWDIQTGENLEISNHSGMNTLQYSLDGQHLLINYPGDTNSTGGVIVLDIATGDMIHNIPHDSHDVSYSPDGVYIASGGDGLRIWDALTGEEVHVFPSESFINNIAYSPDGQTIATTSAEAIQIWDIQTGEVIHDITQRQDYIYDIMYSPDGRYLIYNDWLTLFAIWDIQTATEIETMTNDLHHNTTFIYSPDGQYIVGGGFDLTFWDAYTGEKYATFFQDIPSEIGQPIITNMTYSPDGQFIAGVVSNWIVVWDIQSGEVVHQFDGESRYQQNIFYSPDGLSILVASGENITVWDLETETPTQTYTLRYFITDIVMTTDGRLLAFDLMNSSYHQDPVVVYEIGTSEPIYTLSAGHARYLIQNREGRLLVYGEDGYFFDVETGKIVPTVAVREHNLGLITFNPDFQLMAGSVSEGNIEKNHLTLWNTTTREPIITLYAHTNHIFSVNFNPDGRSIATASADGTIRIWGVPID